jgi:hypothetical protein
MFAVDCPTCGDLSLISPARITAVRNTTNGIHVFFTCLCDTPSVWVTGRDAVRPGLHQLRRVPALAAA